MHNVKANRLLPKPHTSKQTLKPMRGAERIQGWIHLQADDLNVTFTICAFEPVHREAMLAKLGMDSPASVR